MFYGRKSLEFLRNFSKSLKPTMSQQKNSYEFGDFRVDSVERVLMRGGELVPLTPKVFDILLLLVENNGHVVEKETLLKEIWPGTFVEEGSLTQNISVLRKVLGDTGSGRQFIQTIPRRGYRFVGRVDQVIDNGDELIIEEHSLSRVVVERQGDDPEPPASFAPRVVATARTVSNTSAENRRRPRTLYAGLVSLLIMIAVAGFGWRFHLRSRPAAAPFSFENYSWEKLSSDDSTGGGISPDGEFLIYLTGDSNGNWSVRQRRLASLESVTILSRVTSNLWGGALSHDSSFFFYILADQNRDTGTLYKVSVLGGTPRKILERINGGPSLSPDDQRVAFMRANFTPGASAVITASANDGSDEQVVHVNSSGLEVYGAIWFPDGSRLLGINVDRRAEGKFWSLVEIPARGGPVKQVSQPQRQHFWWDAWLPDGSGVVMIASDPISGKQQLYLISYPDGSMQRITNDLNSYAGISISTDGKKLVTNQVERQTRVFVAAPNDLNNPVNVADCCVDRVAWTPDGRIVYDIFERGKWHLWIMNADGTNPQQLSPDNVLDWSPSVSRDGRFLVFLSSRSGHREIWRTDLDGRSPFQITRTDGEIWLPRITPDGQKVYFSQYTAGKWRVARTSIDGGEPEPVAVEASDLWDLSPDGKSLAYSFFDEKTGRWQVAVRPLESNEQIRTFDFAPLDVLVWTPDGAGLVYKLSTGPNPKTTLWRQPVAGGKSQPFAGVSPETIYSANWSPGGEKLAFIRGREVTNIVILKRLGN